MAVPRQSSKNTYRQGTSSGIYNRWRLFLQSPVQKIFSMHLWNDERGGSGESIRYLIPYGLTPFQGAEGLSVTPIILSNSRCCFMGPARFIARYSKPGPHLSDKNIVFEESSKKPGCNLLMNTSCIPEVRKYLQNMSVQVRLM